MAVTPASEWKQANRKVVTLPSGRTVEIRKLTVQFLIASGDILGLTGYQPPDGNLSPEQAVEAAKKWEQALKDADTPERRRQRINYIVKEAVIRPKVVLPDTEPKEDELHPADFGEDLGPLLTAITEMNPELFAPPFRPEAGRGDGAPGGGGLRDTAEPTPPGDAGGSPDRPDGAPAGADGGGGVSATPQTMTT